MKPAKSIFISILFRRLIFSLLISIVAGSTIIFVNYSLEQSGYISSPIMSFCLSLLIIYSAMIPIVYLVYVKRIKPWEQNKYTEYKDAYIRENKPKECNNGLNDEKEKFLSELYLESKTHVNEKSDKSNNLCQKSYADKKEAAIKYYTETDMTMDEISFRTGISVPTIYKEISNRSIQNRKDLFQQQIRKSINKAIELYTTTDIPLSSISKSTNISRQTIYTELKKRHIPTRKIGAQLKQEI